MDTNQIKQILSHNSTNRYLFEHLDDNTLGVVANILANLPASDFVELNPNASEQEKQNMFSLLDVPIPVSDIPNQNQESKTSFSEEIDNEMNTLLEAINKENTNVEYPYSLFGEKNSENLNYQTFHKMYDPDNIATLQGQAVAYDSAWINKFVSENDNVNLALMHTHPSSLDKEHNTLYTKHKNILSQLGVKPNGLNLSLADVNTQIVVENAINKLNKNINFESVILMHDGTLVSFNTKNGLKLTTNKNIEKSQEKEEQVESTSQTNINEFGEIIRSENTEIKQDPSIPTFTPPEPKVEPVPLEIIRPLQEELFPETYGEEAKKVVIEKYNQIAQQQEINKEI